jgi:hypothetical protein
MNRYRIITYLLAAIVSAINTTTLSGQENSELNRQRAVALWEEAIRAKGGHDRLQSIQNLLISSTIEVRTQRGFKLTDTERLYVMPMKAWIYTFTPDLDVSLDATVMDIERNFCAVTFAPASNDVPPLSACIPSTPVKFLIQDPVIYLMETKWAQPVPLGVRVEGKGKKQIDVIETKVGPLKVDFYLDRKTRLPFRLVTDWFGGITQATLRGGLVTISLEDYFDIDGILMPRRVTRELEGNVPVGEVFRRDTERADYKFNVTYNPKIFESAASKKMKRHDWKP